MWKKFKSLKIEEFCEKKLPNLTISLTGMILATGFSLVRFPAVRF